MDDTYKSLNLETGLLEDIDEVRQVGLVLSSLFKKILTNPVFSLIVSVGMRVDLATIVASSEVMLRPTSQAAYMRQLLMLTYGVLTTEMEEAIRAVGYSETLPTTHPDAPQPDVSVDPNSPEVEGSQFLQKLLKDGAIKAEKKEEPKTDLPKSLDDFLDGLANRTYKPEEE